MMEILEGLAMGVATVGGMLGFVWVVSPRGAWDGFGLHAWLMFRRRPEAERHERVLAAMRRRDVRRRR